MTSVKHFDDPDGPKLVAQAVMCVALMAFPIFELATTGEINLARQTPGRAQMPFWLVYLFAIIYPIFLGATKGRRVIWALLARPYLSLSDDHLEFLGSRIKFLNIRNIEQEENRLIIQTQFGEVVTIQTDPRDLFEVLRFINASGVRSE